MQAAIAQHGQGRRVPVGKARHTRGSAQGLQVQGCKQIGRRADVKDSTKHPPAAHLASGKLGMACTRCVCKSSWKAAAVALAHPAPF